MLKTKKQEIDLAVVDVEELKKMNEKQKKIDRVMDIIKANNLEGDEEFMKAINEAFDGILEIQKESHDL